MKRQYFVDNPLKLSEQIFFYRTHINQESKHLQFRISIDYIIAAQKELNIDTNFVRKGWFIRGEK